MVVKLLLTAIILYQVVQTRTNRLYSIPEIKKHFFHNVNTNLHNPINKIFSYFKTMQYFATAENNELLLQIHDDLMNVTEMNFKTYFFVKNVSVTNYSTGAYANMYIDAINENVREMLRDNKDLNPLKYFRTTNDIAESILNETDINKDENESTEFLKDFLKTFENITIESLTDFDNNTESKMVTKENVGTTESAGVKLILKSKTLELKVWNSSAVDPLLPNQTRRLYQGKPTKIKKYPFLASVHIMNNFMCSGSIISKDLVVTAASCLQVAYSHHENPRSVFIRVGSDYTKSFGQLIPATEIHFHSDYDPRTLRNNIAAIRILKNLKLSNEKGRIRRIEYDRGQKAQTEGIYVLGWGALEPKHNPSNYQKLSIDYLKIYTFAECKEIYSEVYVAESNFCAGFTDKGSGACNKDVGGPGFRNGVLVGIVSYGPPNCGMPNSPTVFTQVGYYADWLDGLVRQKKVVRQAKPVKTSFIMRKELESEKVIKKYVLRLNPNLSEGMDTNIFSKETDYVANMNNTFSQDYAATINPNILRQDYSEEVVILQEILKDILTANASLLNDIKENNKRQGKKNNNKVNFDVNSYKKHYNSKPDKPNNNKPDKPNKSTPNNNKKPVPGDSCGDCSDESAKSRDTSNCNSCENVSDNYEERLNEIAIDANDPAFKNASFLDVVFNIEQYRKPNRINNKTGETRGVTNYIDIQFIMGTTNIPTLTKKRNTIKNHKSLRIGENQERKLYYDDIEVGREQKDEFKLNFESDKDPLVSDIKNIIGTIPKVKEIYYRRNNPLSFKRFMS